MKEQFSFAAEDGESADNRIDKELMKKWFDRNLAKFRKTNAPDITCGLTWG